MAADLVESLAARWTSAAPAALAALEAVRATASWVARAGGEACLVAFLVLIAQRLLRARVSARWRYNLWLLVLARLVLPAVPEASFSPFNLLKRTYGANRTIASVATTTASPTGAQL